MDQVKNIAAAEPSTENVTAQYRFDSRVRDDARRLVARDPTHFRQPIVQRAGVGSGIVYVDLSHDGRVDATRSTA